MEIKYYNFDFDEIGINPGQLYVYLRLNQAVDIEPFQSIIDHEIECARTLSGIKGGLLIFDNVQVKNDSIYIKNQWIQPGKNISTYLKKSTKIAIFACTAGIGIETHSRKLMAEGKLLEGYISDSIGSLIVENAMDKIYNLFQKETNLTELKISNRYSPGYCSWNVSDQKILFSLLPDKFCGITLSLSSMMNPIKSISGIIGIGKEIRYFDYSCDTCNSQDCIYRDVRYKNSMS